MISEIPKFPAKAILGLTLVALIAGCSQSISPNNSQGSNPPVSPSPTEPQATAFPTDPVSTTNTNQKSSSPDSTEKPTNPSPTDESTKSPSSDSKAPIAKTQASENRKLLFSCATENGKQILLHDAGKTIDYAFGTPDREPELDLRVPRSQASTWQWAGIGRYMSYSIDVPNGDTVYNVFWGVDRLSQNAQEEAGVNVLIKDKIVATVNCSSNIVNQMEGVDLKKRDGN